MATITIQYNSEYGTVPSQVTLESNIPIILTKDILPTLTDNNGVVTFVGWYTDSAFTDDSLLMADSTYTPTESITLYARWEVIVTIYESTLIDIANAIRDKKNSTDTYKPGEMPSEIKSISSNGIPDNLGNLIEVIAAEDISTRDIVYLIADHSQPTGNISYADTFSAYGANFPEECDADYGTKFAICSSDNSILCNTFNTTKDRNIIDLYKVENHKLVKVSNNMLSNLRMIDVRRMAFSSDGKTLATLNSGYRNWTKDDGSAASAVRNHIEIYCVHDSHIYKTDSISLSSSMNLQNVPFSLSSDGSLLNVGNLIYQIDNYKKIATSTIGVDAITLDTIIDTAFIKDNKLMVAYRNLATDEEPFTIGELTANTENGINCVTSNDASLSISYPTDSNDDTITDYISVGQRASNYATHIYVQPEGADTLIFGKTYRYSVKIRPSTTTAVRVNVQLCKSQYETEGNFEKFVVLSETSQRYISITSNSWATITQDFLVNDSTVEFARIKIIGGPSSSYVHPLDIADCYLTIEHYDSIISVNDIGEFDEIIYTKQAIDDKRITSCDSSPNGNIYWARCYDYDLGAGMTIKDRAIAYMNIDDYSVYSYDIDHTVEVAAYLQGNHVTFSDDNSMFVLHGLESDYAHGICSTYDYKSGVWKFDAEQNKYVFVNNLTNGTYVLDCIDSVAFSKDNSLIVTAESGKLRLHSAADMSFICDIDTCGQYINQVYVSFDNSTIIAISDENDILTYKIDCTTFASKRIDSANIQTSQKIGMSLAAVLSDATCPVVELSPISMSVPSATKTNVELKSSDWKTDNCGTIWRQHLIGYEIDEYGTNQDNGQYLSFTSSGDIAIGPSWTTYTAPMSIEEDLDRLIMLFRGQTSPQFNGSYQIKNMTLYHADDASKTNMLIHPILDTDLAMSADNNDVFIITENDGTQYIHVGKQNKNSRQLRYFTNISLPAGDYIFECEMRLPPEITYQVKYIDDIEPDSTIFLDRQDVSVPSHSKNRVVYATTIAPDADLSVKTIAMHN